MDEFTQKRLAFEKVCRGITLNKKTTINRVTCPCCGYPTLKEKFAYEICEICNWEDDGEDDFETGTITEPGGANGDYLLREARKNFVKYRIMYTPDNNTTVTGADSEEREGLKADLIKIFEKILITESGHYTELWQAAVDIELKLYKELKRSLKQASKNNIDYSS